MKNAKKGNKLKRLFRFLYLKIFRINDTPSRIAMGFGLGVFLGVLPGTGPIAALTLAILFRLNRASALLGSVLTNTWLNFFTFVFSVKIGARVLSLDWHLVMEEWSGFLKEFRFKKLLQASYLKLVLPVMLGYFIIGLLLGVISYLIILAVLSSKQKRKGGGK